MHHPSLVASRRLLAAPLLTILVAAAVSPAFAQDAADPSAVPTPAESAASPDAQVEAAGIDGTWIIDTEIGDFADYSSSWVGFRVAEVLQNIGEAEAVGRTPAVAGQLVAEGSTIQSALVEVDLTTITSDQPRRDPAIQRALDTATFQIAALEMREPIDLEAVPADGSPFSAMLPARLTIHGVTQDVDVPLDGQRVGDAVVVVGTLPIDFTSFGITMPTAPIVLSVEDSGELEFQLFFRREAASSEDASASE